MRRPWLTGLFGICVLIVAVGVVLFTRPREPRYNGRSLSQWLEIEYRAGLTPSLGDREAEEAIRRIGTNALPWLVKWADAESTWEYKFWKVIDGIPRPYRSVFPKHVLTRPEISDMTFVGYMILGREASPCVPQLDRLIQHSNPPHQNVLIAIHCLPYLGPAARAILVELTAHSDPTVRSAARTALIGTMGEVPIW